MRNWPCTEFPADAVERVLHSLMRKRGRIRPEFTAMWLDGRFHKRVMSDQSKSRSGVLYNKYFRLRQRNRGVWL